MQEIWKTGLQWNELLPPEIQENWDNVVKEKKVPEWEYPVNTSLILRCEF